MTTTLKTEPSLTDPNEYIIKIPAGITREMWETAKLVLTASIPKRVFSSSAAQVLLLRFYIEKNNEVLAYGCVFQSSGKCVVAWEGAHRSVVVWDSLEDLKAVNGHPDRQIIFY